MPNGTLDLFSGVKTKASDEPFNEQSVSKAANVIQMILLKKCTTLGVLNGIRLFLGLKKKVQYDRQTKAICLWCNNFGKTNSMVTTGSCKLQSSTFMRMNVRETT